MNRTPKLRWSWANVCAGLFGIATLWVAMASGWAAAVDLTQLSIEELMNVTIVSATKQTQRLADTASAVFVITQDDIRRSGVTSVPEALRLAPGVQVARVDANKWAISIRGFNGRFANKLLVLVDGRSIYTPTFAGVYWEIQDILLEDIERIEVIRGPEASLWGANAVNGVINILTKQAAETQGLVSVTAGDPKNTIVGMRYSGALGDDAHYRLFAKSLNQAGLLDQQGRDAEDDWRLGSGGFRLDWTPTGRDNLSLQGDLYHGMFQQNLSVPNPMPPYEQRIHDDAQMSGGYLQGHWERVLSDTSRWSLQMYYQNQQRQDAVSSFNIDTFNIALQYNLTLNAWNALIWGLEYRRYYDQYQQTALSSITPSKLEYDLLSAFIQDRISLIPDKLELILGARLEHSDFSDLELQPNIRLLWSPHPKHRLWAAVSRAVRTPARIDNGLNLNWRSLSPQPPLSYPTLIVLQGNPAFTSEKLTSYELGYRAWTDEQLSLDIAVFYNDYRDLEAIELRSDLAIFENNQLQIPALFINGAQGRTYGFEATANWQVTDQWRLQLAYSYLRMQNKPDAPDLTMVFDDTTAPRHQISLFSSFNIGRDVELDLWLRHVDTISFRDLEESFDAYLSLNARFGWHLRKDLEWSLVGTNLLGSPHVEFTQEIYPFLEQVERTIYGQIKWSF